MSDWVIYGAGGLGREIAGWLSVFLRGAVGTGKILGFIDDEVPAGRKIFDFQVLGGLERLESTAEPTSVVIAIADPAHKERLYTRLKSNPNIVFPSLVHPSAYVDANACLAEGVVVSPFCFVASGASLETCCFLNVGSMVGHDSVLGPFCSVMPDVNISGGVTIKARAFIGVGAKILQGLSVGSDAVAGIGSIVVSNVRDGTTVMGNPAKVIREAKQP